MTVVKRIGHYIGGSKVFEGHGSRYEPVTDPAKGEVVAEVAMAGPTEVDFAVSFAKQAFAEWKGVSLARRVKILFEFRDLLMKHRDDLAVALTKEHGKVLEDARGEVLRGLEVVEFACGVPQLLKGEFSENVSTDVDSFSIRQPLGVVAGVTPFNFPVMVPLWMFPLAIACGNTFILKPSEKDPSPANLMAELFAKAGLPPGVFNVAHGDGATVDHLLDHPDVAAVSFVGSTRVARHIYERGTRNGKRIQALGGAKNHMVVLPDADMDVAADASVNAAFGSSGQRCMAISVLILPGGSAELLLPKVVERMAHIKVGRGMEPTSDMGPLTTRGQLERVLSYLDQGVRDGATLLVDGRKLDPEERAEGFFLGPSLFDHVRPEMSIYRDEIFGPVLCALRVPGYDEAMELIHACPYANGAALFTRDGGAARRFQTEVPAGMVGINVPIPVPMAYYSFGGWKESLFGDCHIHGLDGVRFYSRGKVVTSRWPDSAPRGKNLGFPS